MNEFYYSVSKANVAMFSSWASFERSVRKDFVTVYSRLINIMICFIP